MHHRYAIDGRAMSELPIVYYTAAQLYRLFGFHDYYIRLLHFSLYLLGLIYLVKITQLFTNNIALQLTPFLLTITPPLLFFYGANFIPDVAALGLAIVGLYYFLRYDTTYKNQYLIGMLVFSTLAALLKISAGIMLIAFICFFIYQYIFDRKYFDNNANKFTLSILILLSLATIFGWIQYDKFIATKYKFGGNLFGFYGIWDADGGQILYIISRIKKLWMPMIFSNLVWLFLVLAVIYLIARFKKINPTLRSITIFTAIGVLLYCLAWFRTFDVHDYYLVNTLCLPVLIFICFIDVIDKQQWLATNKNQFYFTACIIIFFLYASYKSMRQQHYRYFEPEFNTFNKDYYEVEPYLRSIGLQPNDLVVSVPDPSPNMSLYLMNQIGFTECYNSQDYNVNHFIFGEKAKYLIISDSNYIHNPLYQPFCKPENKVGQFNSISIYKTGQ